MPGFLYSERGLRDLGGLLQGEYEQEPAMAKLLLLSLSSMSVRPSRSWFGKDRAFAAPWHESTGSEARAIFVTAASGD